MAPTMLHSPRLKRQPLAQRIAAAGFSLTELLVVSAIAATLAAVAVPSFAGFLATQRSSSTVTRFVGSLNLARSEAIKRNGRMALCKSADGRWLMQHGRPAPTGYSDPEHQAAFARLVELARGVTTVK